MQKLIATDGTEIAFERSGSGPALIIVGGSLADHQFYVLLANELSSHFTVYTYDRRGRGQSGDTSPYAVERELEDLAALVDQAREPVFVYGHSAGSALALRAAASGLGIARLVLADPPFTPHSENDEVAKAAFAEEAARIRELHDSGDYRASIKLFLGGMGVPDEAIEGMLDSPAGASMTDSARALPYDYAVLGDGLVPTNLAAKVTVPTVILAARAMPETAQALADAMPNARFEAMEGSAYETPPAEMAERVTGFLGSRGVAPRSLLTVEGHTEVARHADPSLVTACSRDQPTRAGTARDGYQWGRASSKCRDGRCGWSDRMNVRQAQEPETMRCSSPHD